MYTECTRDAASFARYAREHPANASDLYILFAKQMAALEPTTENVSHLKRWLEALEGRDEY